MWNTAIAQEESVIAGLHNDGMMIDKPAMGIIIRIPGFQMTRHAFFKTSCEATSFAR